MKHILLDVLECLQNLSEIYISTLRHPFMCCCKSTPVLQFGRWMALLSGEQLSQLQTG